MTPIEQTAQVNMGSEKQTAVIEKMRIAPEKTKWLDIQIERASEWFSSILVKESRQALKSRQFLWTFFLMLITVATWTLFALSYFYSELSGDSVAPGPFLLSGYWMILGFPLAIIIPYSAHRSLAAEMEDGTLQLVSITTMRPYQIISGKLGSACLQMITYLSVIAPCIVFTYLLRGVDLIQVFLGFSIAITGCIFLSIAGLLLATVSRNRLIGLVISILMVLGLGLAYWLWIVYSFTSTFFGSGMRSALYDPAAQMALWVCFGTAITTAAVFFTAACSQIAFEAENRSTAIRIALLVQQTFALGLVVSAVVFQTVPNDAYWIFAMWYGHYWLLLGSMLVSVPNNMSRRVRRRLPAKIWSKGLFSLLMPGPGRGYLFAVANLIACFLSFCCLVFFGDILLTLVGPNGGVNGSIFPQAITKPFQTIFSIYTATLYPIFFLTVVFLLVRLRKKRQPNSSPIMGALIAGILVAFSAILGFVLQFNILPYSNSDYTIFQALNWYTTTDESFSAMYSEATVAILFMSVFTAGLVFVAFRIAGRELLIGELAVPKRVQEDIKENKKIQLAPGESIDEIFAAPREE